MTSRRVAITLLAVLVSVVALGFIANAARPAGSLVSEETNRVASFARDTWVSTEEGPVRIEEIAAGDLIYTYDVDTEVWALRAVNEVVPAYYDYTYIAHLTIGSETIEASANHPVYVVSGNDLASRTIDTPGSSIRRNREGWVVAGNLLVGDTVITMDGDEAQVSGIYTNTASTLLFDLIVDGPPNFAVGESRLLVGDQTLVPETDFAQQVPQYSESSGGGCFPAGTLVQTPAGSVRIDAVEVGTMVSSYDPTAGTWASRRVSAVQSQPFSGEFVTLETAGGSVESTSNHPFLVLSGDGLATRPHPSDVPPSDRLVDGTARWVEARDIKVGDVLLESGGARNTVQSVVSQARGSTVYNITVESSHTYQVGAAGIVVHNKGEAESAEHVEEDSGAWAEPQPSSAPLAADEVSAMEKSSAEPAESIVVAPAQEQTSAADPEMLATPDQLFLSTDDSNSTASPAIVRSIIESGRYVPPQIVRTYEFYNYYSFGYPGAEEGDLGIFANLHETEDGSFSVQAVLRGPDRTLDDLPPLNVVFLVDVSGSMAGESWDIARQFVYRFVEYLRSGDTIALVTISRYSQVVIDQYQVNAGTADYVRTRIDNIVPNDITNLDPGIAAAYEIAERFQRYRGLTRVVLVSDGGANAGDFSGTTISRFAEDAERHGVYLTGVGVGNGFNDGLMDSLTDSGRGAYFFLDAEQEIDHVLEQFVSYFDLAYKDVRLGMQMPAGWSVRAFHGEQMSTVREEIVPQYLAPSDQMIFHMELAYAGESLRPSDEFHFEAEYTPIGDAPRLAKRSFTLREMMSPSDQLVKADTITAFAEGLKQVRFPLMENRIPNLAVWDEVLAEIRSGQAVLGDADIDQVASLAAKYRTILSEGEQFPESLDRFRTDIPAILGLADGAVRSVETIGPDTDAAIQERSRLRESILLQPMEGYRFLGLSSGPVGNPYPVGSGQLSSNMFEHPVADFMGHAKYYMNRSGVYDRHQIVLELQAPQNAKSFSFDFNFFSAEYPDFVNQSFNDSFYAILKAQSTNSGRPTNISFDPDQNPIEVDNNYFQRRFHPIPNAGTGFDYNGSTGWLRTSWPIRGGERFSLTFTVHDEGDAIYDSMAVLDNFQWHDYPAIGNTDPLN